MQLGDGKPKIILLLDVRRHVKRWGGVFLKKILVLHTGGTIAMSADESGNVTPGDENPLDNYQSSFGTDIELETEDVFNVPSPHITPARMLQLKQRIDKACLLYTSPSPRDTR